jgi:hypothetical protein
MTNVLSEWNNMDTMCTYIIIKLGRKLSTSSPGTWLMHMQQNLGWGLPTVIGPKDSVAYIGYVLTSVS